MIFFFRDCKITIGIPFLAFITSILILDFSGNIIWCLLATLVHEFGHMICMIFQQKELREIQFCLFDIKIVDRSSNLRSYKQDLLLMFAGSLANFMVSLIFFIANFIFDENVIKVFVLQNFLIGVFNLLPIDTLDGGQILKCVLEFKLPERVSCKILNLISIIIIIPISTFGFYLLLKSGYNFSLLLISLYLLVKVTLDNHENKRWIK